MAAVVAMFTLGIVNQAQAGTIGVRQNPGGNWVMTYNGMPTKSFGTDKQGCVEYAKNIAQVTGSGYDSSGETGNGTDTDGGSGTDTGGGSGTNTGGGGTGTGGAGGGGDLDKS